MLSTQSVCAPTGDNDTPLRGGEAEQLNLPAELSRDKLSAAATLSAAVHRARRGAAAAAEATLLLLAAAAILFKFQHAADIQC